MRISGNTWKARKNSRMLSIKNCACAKKMLAIQTPSGYNKHQRKCSGFYFFHLLIYFSMRYSRIFPDSHLMIYLTLARSEVFGALQHTWMLTQRRMEQADCPLSISGNQLSSNHTAGIFSKNWPVIIISHAPEGMITGPGREVDKKSERKLRKRVHAKQILCAGNSRLTTGKASGCG